MFEKFPNTKFY